MKTTTNPKWPRFDGASFFFNFKLTHYRPRAPLDPRRREAHHDHVHERKRATKLGYPKCSMPDLIHQEGCDVCTSCGYSKCA